ncbi:MAG: PH domain-containing protein [Myxococcota bacterium]
MASEPDWSRLHPASVLVNLVPRMWSLLRSAWPLLLAMLYGGRTREGLFDVAIGALFLGVALGAAAIHAFTLRYRVADGKLEIRSGLLNRQARVIACDRVQNVEQVQNVFQRVFGLVEVRIETASGREVEGLLSAVSSADAVALTAALEAGRSTAAGFALPLGEPHPAASDVPLVRSGPIELVWYGASDLRIGAVAMGLVVVGELVPGVSARIGQASEAFGSLVGVAVALALVSGGWLAGIAAAVVRFWGFELRSTPRALIAEQGLLTRRRAELRRDKVQLVTWREPVLLRPFGFGSLAIETAAAREGGSGTERSEAVVPYVERDGVGDLVRAVLPVDDVDPASVSLHPAAPGAGPYAMIGAAIRTAIPAVLLAGVLWPNGALAFGLVPAAIALARLDVARQGWRVTDRWVVARRGVLTRSTAMIARAKLQSVVLIQGPILRRFGLGRLSLRVAGSRVDLPVLRWADARALQDQLTRELRLSAERSNR